MPALISTTSSPLSRQWPGKRKGIAMRNFWSSCNFKPALLGLAFSILASGCAGQTDFRPPSQSAVRNDPTSLGVIDKKGNWILPPLFKEIVYVKKLRAFWVKERQPADSKWKLVDQEGKGLWSNLPSDQEPLRQWPPPQCLGFSAYPEAMPVMNKDGAGLSEPDGKPIAPCKYHSIHDVGEGFWLAQPGREEAKNATEVLVPQASLGDVFKLPPAFVLINEKDNKVQAVDKNVAMPDGYFVNGILVCKSYSLGPNMLRSSNGTIVLPSHPITARLAQEGGINDCAIDKSGQMVIPPGGPIPVSKAARSARLGAPRSFNSFYYLPISPSAPIKLIDISKKTGLPSEVEPIAVAEGIALAKTQDDTVGLINRKGEWLIPPDYNRLGYCEPDRFVCAKGRLSMDQQKELKNEFSAPDIR